MAGQANTASRISVWLWTLVRNLGFEPWLPRAAGLPTGLRFHQQRAGDTRWGGQCRARTRI